MKDVISLDNLEAMRALSDPRRLEILRALVAEPLTAGGIAKEIGEQKSRLYYHISEMEKFGLIEVVEERKKRNFIEKVYRATAKFYTVDRGIFAGEHGMEVLVSNVTSILDATASDVHRLIDSGRLDADRVEDIRHGHRRLHLTAEERDEFVKRFGELLDEFSGGESGEGVMFSFVIYPEAR